MSTTIIAYKEPPKSIASIHLTSIFKSQTIIGNAGDNVLSSGGGAADTMLGGGGNDTYIVGSVNDVISEGAGSGTDTIRTSLSSYSMSMIGNVENSHWRILKVRITTKDA